jgi:hypothetical protein
MKEVFFLSQWEVRKGRSLCTLVLGLDISGFLLIWKQQKSLGPKDILRIPQRANPRDTKKISNLPYPLIPITS